MNNLRFAVLVALAVAALQLGSFGILPTPTASALTNCTVSDLSIDAEEARFLTLINDYRPAGSPDLVMSVELNRSATWMAVDLTHSAFSHTDSLGRDPWTRMAQCDVPVGSEAENLAAWYVTADDVFAGWRSSPGHDRNMLDPSYNYIGIARVCCGPEGQWFWATDFDSVGTPLAGGSGVGAPANVAVTNPTATTLDVYFSDTASNEAATEIERSTAGGAFSVVFTTGALPGTQAGWYWQNTGLAGSTQYCYRLRARDANNVYSTYSNTACGTTTANALGAPSNVSVTQPTSTGLNIFFNDNATTESAIDIERSQGSAGPWTVIKSTGQLPGAQAGWYWPDSGLNQATQYCYRLRARDATTFSAYSNVACGTTTGSSLPAPSGVSIANPTSSGLNVYFNDNATTETGFEIERSVGTTGTWGVVKTIGVLSGAQQGWYWPDSGLNPSTQYCYRMRATNGGTFSAYSNIGCGTTLAGAGTLAAPSSVVTANPTRTGLNVYFTDNATTETGIDIERSVGQNGTWAVVTTTNALPGAQAGWYWPDSGRNPGTQYCYRLRARNGNTFSAYSNIACGTTAP